MDTSSETEEAAAAPVSPKEEEQAIETEPEPSKAISDSLSSESHLPHIWSHYLEQLQKIDELERKLDERATRSRRRVQTILDQTPSYRNSHLRMFITHQFQNALSHQALWTLVIEGKPLVGLLDHESAARVDAEGSLSAIKKTPVDMDGSKKSYMPTAAKATAAAPGGTGTAQVGGSAGTASNPNAIAAMGSSDKYRFQGGEAEDYSLDPTFFTHFFHKMEVVFRTVYEPRTATAATPTPTKKARNKRKADRQDVNMASPGSVNPRDLRASEPTHVIWNQTNSADADAFFVQYSDHYSDRPMPPGMKFHSIVANISLYPIRPEETYKPSKKLAETLFPRHVENPFRQAAIDQADGPDAKKRRTEGEPVPQTTIPLENDIQVPALLTMKEITTAIYMYIQKKGLQDSVDKSIINLDKTLQSLFERETMNFAELRQALFAKNLISEVGKDDEPVILTYVMTKEGVSQQQPAGTTTASSQTAAEKTANTPAATMVAPEGSKPAPDIIVTPTVFSFDMDIAIPSLFHYRSRELLHKIKKREFEYTSSRTRARYLLVACRGNEDIVKTKIEQVIAGQGYAGENVPIYLALAKAAPPKSEARVAAQIDAQTCAILERLEECNRQAEAAWELVDACKELSAKS